MTPRRKMDGNSEHMRALEGEWRFEALEVDGSNTPAAMLAHSMLLLDGDRFRMVSPEATYDGRFSIDTSTKPMHIDIDFVEGPEAGNRAYGLFQLDDDRLTICLGLVGSRRPTAFVTQPGSGHALERLRRASATRPTSITGGVAAERPARSQPVPAVDSAEFDVEMNPTLARLEGAWMPIRLVTGGEEMRADWLPFGSRVVTRNEAKVIFGGRVMLHVKFRLNESVKPIAVDYLHLHGRDAGRISKGIMEWVGDDVCFLMAAPGQDRPTDFAWSDAGSTFSRWKRRSAD